MNFCFGVFHEYYVKPKTSNGFGYDLGYFIASDYQQYINASVNVERRKYFSKGELKGLSVSTALRVRFLSNPQTRIARNYITAEPSLGIQYKFLIYKDLFIEPHFEVTGPVGFDFNTRRMELIPYPAIICGLKLGLNM